MRRDLGTGLRRGSQSGVSELVFGSVYDGARRGVHWLYHEAGHSSPRSGRVSRLVFPRPNATATWLLLTTRYSTSTRIRLFALEQPRRCDWEDAIVSLEEGWTPNPRSTNTDYLTWVPGIIYQVLRNTRRAVPRLRQLSSK